MRSVLQSSVYNPMNPGLCFLGVCLLSYASGCTRSNYNLNQDSVDLVLVRQQLDEIQDEKERCHTQLSMCQTQNTRLSGENQDIRQYKHRIEELIKKNEQLQERLHAAELSKARQCSKEEGLQTTFNSLQEHLKECKQKIEQLENRMNVEKEKSEGKIQNWIFGLCAVLFVMTLLSWVIWFIKDRQILEIHEKSRSTITTLATSFSDIFRGKKELPAAIEQSESRFEESDQTKPKYEAKRKTSTIGRSPCEGMESFSLSESSTMSTVSSVCIAYPSMKQEVAESLLKPGLEQRNIQVSLCKEGEAEPADFCCDWDLYVYHNEDNSDNLGARYFCFNRVQSTGSFIKNPADLWERIQNYQTT